jgi:hypothetical protein
LIAGFIEWLSASGFAAWAAGGNVYPAANVAHLLGLVLLLGSIGIVDLRIMGAFRTIPAGALAGALTPLAIAGLIILALSGTTLFAADAASVAASGVFRWKLVSIALALANALAFRRWLRPGPMSNAMARQFSAAVSLAAWLTAATLGRLIAYS